jgi:hypothetical protein
VKPATMHLPPLLSNARLGGVQPANPETGKTGGYAAFAAAGRGGDREVDCPWESTSCSGAVAWASYASRRLVGIGSFGPLQLGYFNVLVWRVYVKRRKCKTKS